MELGAVALIIAVFFFISILTISLEAAFRSESKKNLDKGIKKGEESKIDFPPPDIEQPKKD